MVQKYVVFKNEDVTGTEANRIIKSNKYVLELYDYGFAFYIDGMWVADASDLLLRGNLILPNNMNKNKLRHHIFEENDNPDDVWCQGCKEGRTYYKLKDRTKIEKSFMLT